MHNPHQLLPQPQRCRWPGRLRRQVQTIIFKSCLGWWPEGRMDPEVMIGSGWLSGSLPLPHTSEYQALIPQWSWKYSGSQSVWRIIANYIYECYGLKKCLIFSHLKIQKQVCTFPVILGRLWRGEYSENSYLLTLIWFVEWSLSWSAVTSDHRLGSLTQQKFMLSQFGRLKAKFKMSARFCSLQNLYKFLSLSLPASSSSWKSWQSILYSSEIPISACPLEIVFLCVKYLSP